MSEEDALLPPTTQSVNDPRVDSHGYTILPGESVGSPEEQPPASPGPWRQYSRRWYVLLVFTLVGLTQGWTWNTWGPVAASSAAAFGWSQGMVALLPAWGPIAYLPAAMPFGWLMQAKGLRWTTLTAASLILCGSIIKCVSVQPHAFVWLANAGQLLNGLAGPALMAGTPVVAATWFGPGQRTVATALSNRFISIGGGVPLILGPWLVRDVTNNTAQLTRQIFLRFIDKLYDYVTMRPINSTIAEMRQDVQHLMFIELGVAGLAWLAVLVYLPSRPPTPPGPAAAQPKTKFWPGLAAIVRYRNFWVLGLPYAATYGIWVGWYAALDLSLQPLHVDQRQSGYIGFVGVLCSAVAGVAMARLVDRLQGRSRLILMLLYAGTAGSTLWFALMGSNIIRFHLIEFYASRVVGGVCMGALVPLMFETLCETCYPIPEPVTTIVITIGKNVSVLIFLGILFVPNIGTAWMDWLMAGAAALCCPLVLAYKETRARILADLAPPADQNKSHSMEDTED